MTEQIKIILVDEEEITQILIENYLKELTFSYSFEKCNEIDFSILNNTQKKIVIVNINQTDNSTLLEVKKQSSNPNTVFILISHDTTADLNVKAIRAGAKEFLTKPIIKKDFLEIIKNIKSTLKTKEEPTAKCSINLVMSVEKEVGKTFFALNTAKEVADVSKEKVLLIDFNNDLNDLSSKLNMDFIYNTSYFVDEIIKDNYEALGKINRYQKSSLYIMANGVFCNNISHDNDNYEIFFQKIKKHFRYIFLDVSPGMEFNKSIIKNTDTIYTILEPSMSMFSNASAVVQRNYKGKRVRYILNKFNENKESELISKLENIINKQIFLRIPLNHMATNASISHGKTLKELSPKLDVVDKYLKLANFIASRE